MGVGVGLQGGINTSPLSSLVAQTVKRLSTV